MGVWEWTLYFQESSELAERTATTFRQASLEIHLGRVKGNELVVPLGNVSKRHCKLYLEDNVLYLVNTRSTGGTYMNGGRIGDKPVPFQPFDKLYLGNGFFWYEEPPRYVESELPPAAESPTSGE